MTKRSQSSVTPTRIPDADVRPARIGGKGYDDGEQEQLVMALTLLDLDERLRGAAPSDPVRS
jgi:hypothetical protein